MVCMIDTPDRMHKFSRPIIAFYQNVLGLQEILRCTYAFSVCKGVSGPTHFRIPPFLKIPHPHTLPTNRSS